MADNILDFESLGKKAADLLSKGYDAGKLKVSAESSASNGVKFSADGKTKLGTDDPVEGSLKVTYKNKEKGIKVDEKWETSGKVSSTVTASDVGVDGLELALGVSYEEENNKASQSGKLTVKFANEHAAVGVVGKMVRGSKPTIDVDLTAGHAGFIAGVAAGHDGANRKPVDVKVSYVERPVQVTFSGENNFGTLGLSFYHEVSSCWNTAGAVSWERGTSKPKIEIGGECKCDGGSKVKAKVDSDAQVSCSMTQDIHSGVSATLSCSTDGKKFLSASPEAVKIGFALKFSD